MDIATVDLVVNALHYIFPTFDYRESGPNSTSMSQTKLEAQLKDTRGILLPGIKKRIWLEISWHVIPFIFACVLIVSDDMIGIYFIIGIYFST
uniref:Uncharacterized protein n=1 Tax=Triticum urartu TaxID=4572 RepID=A0A8R7QDT7_TRIUA